MMVHCNEINNKIITIMCERFSPMNDFARLMAASIVSVPGAPAAAASGIAVNTMKQLQILADILTSTALMEDKEAIMLQVLRNSVSILTAAYDDGQLDAAGLQDQAAVDLEYLLRSIRSLPLAEHITEGCTHDMRALHLRKLSSNKAHKEAKAKLAELAAAVTATAGAAAAAPAKAVEPPLEAVEESPMPVEEVPTLPVDTAEPISELPPQHVETPPPVDAPNGQEGDEEPSEEMVDIPL